MKNYYQNFFEISNIAKKIKKNEKLTLEDVKTGILKLFKSVVDHEDAVLEGKNIINDICYNLTTNDEFAKRYIEKDLMPINLIDLFIDKNGFKPELKKIVYSKCTENDYNKMVDKTMELIDNTEKVQNYKRDNSTILNGIKKLRELDNLRKRHNPFVRFFMRLFGNKEDEKLNEAKNKFHTIYENIDLNTINELIEEKNDELALNKIKNFNPKISDLVKPFDAKEFDEQIPNNINIEKNDLNKENEKVEEIDSITIAKS